MSDLHSQKILILDFGSQYTQLIARRIREAGVYCEIQYQDMSAAAIRAFGPQGIILSGGPESVTADNTPRANDAIFSLGVPVLGICYGMQTMAAQLGGKVAPSDHREYGYAQIKILNKSKLFGDLNDGENKKVQLLDVWMSHGDRVTTLPDGFQAIAGSDNAPLAAITDETRNFYGLQFHPEVTHTKQGQQIMDNFIHKICGCASDWVPGNIIDDIVVQTRKKVGDDRVILGLSGGVDSSVVAALLHKAIGKQLTCIFVDNGLLRLNEGDQVMETFADHMGVNVIRVDAEERFLKKLKGVSDPEEKRKQIGYTFIEIFEEEAEKIANAKWLAQGTIYPDVIESPESKMASHMSLSHTIMLADYRKIWP